MNVVSMRGNIDPSYYRLLAGEQQQGSLIGTFEARHPSIAERLAAGKALREKVPRTSHATYESGADRPDPIEILEKQNVARVQRLVPVRYARMLPSPFTFLRGSASVMASDLSRTPVTGLAVAACGDMHVSNFGVYASAERTLVFAINDFDEVHPGPWEWDIKRLAASAAVAVRFMGGDDDEARDAARACVRSYRKRIRRYAEMGYLEVWYDHIDDSTVLHALSPRARREAERSLDKARARGHMHSLAKLTEQVDGEPRIIEDSPLIVRETHTDTGVPIRAALDQMLGAYIQTLPVDRRRLLSRYRIIDAVRKVVGVGSVGTGCWVILLEGVDDDDPLFLQVKEAQSSVLAAHVDLTLPFDNHGQRVVVGQRTTQGSPDVFLGWGEVDGRHFYIRQLADMKGSASFVEGDEQGIGSFIEYCGLCGWALALAHAKSGDPAMIAGYCGSAATLDDAIATFALAYARQTDEDHEALDRARRSGRIKVAAETVVK
jgi:uncharacterized protein (DUF2252 family)